MARVLNLRITPGTERTRKQAMTDYAKYAIRVLRAAAFVWLATSVSAGSMRPVLFAQRPSAAPTATAAPDAAWPREARRSGMAVLMYQPQIEQLTQNDVEARAAVQITAAGKEPVFGAVWIAAEVDVDRDARIVTFRDVRIPRVRVVDASDSEREGIGRALEQEIRGWNLEMDLDRFIPLLDVAEIDRSGDSGIKNDPPRIIVASEPTTLIVLDGVARRQPITDHKEAEQAKLERVVNTPALTVYHPDQTKYYLAGGGDLWYEGSEAAGPYTPAKTVPRAVAALAPKSQSTDANADGIPPKIIVATEPTELIVIAGRPQYAPIADI